MAKPTIVTRAGKGSALTWTEGDANLTNLRDATISVTDGTNTKALNLNDTLTFTAGTNMSVAVNSSTGAVTISNTGSTFDPASPGAIGGTTPAAGTFTDITRTGNKSGIVFTNSGFGGVNIAAATFTDTTSTAGNAATAYAYKIGAPTFSATNAQNIVDGGTLYVQKPQAGTGAALSNYNASIRTDGDIIVGPTSTGVKIYASGDIGLNSATGTIYGIVGSSGLNYAGYFSSISGPLNGTVGATTPQSGTFTTTTIRSASELRFNNSANTFYVALKAGTLSASTTYVLPTAYPGFSGYVLSSASNGVLSWIAPTSGTVTSIATSGSVSGITLTGGTITGSGTITLGGTLDLSTPPAIGGTTAAAGAFTTLSASSTVSGTGFSNYLASPPTIGGTTPGTVNGTTISVQPANGNAGYLRIYTGDGTKAISFQASASTTVSQIYTLPISAPGTTGYVLSSNTTGVLSWVAPSSFDPASPGAIGGTTPAAITGTTITANTAFSGPHNGTVGATTPNTGAFTTLSASSTVSGTGFSTYLASPPAIGSTTASTGAFTTLTVKAANDLRLNNSADTFYVALKAGTLAASTTYTMPTAYPGTTGYVLSSTTAGVLSWVANGSFDPASPGAIGGTTPAAGTFTVLTAKGATNNAKLVLDTTAVTSTAWTTNGIGLKIQAATFTDTSSTAGTVAASHIHTIAAPTLASNNVITVTDAATLYISGDAIAGTNTTITNNWALLTPGDIKAGTFTSSVATGTAPFTVTSTTNVPNLNASSLNGATFASPGAIGGTTANTGAFTTLSATTTGTSGAINVTYNPASTSGSAIQATGKDSQGGVGYFDFLKATNTTTGVTNGSKTIRLNSTGELQVINSGYSATILALSDAGLLTAQSLSLTKDLREQVYTGGSTTGTITPDCANGTVQKITLTGAITFNAFANPVAGQSLTLIINQGTGGFTLTSTMLFSGASKTLSTAANAVDILTVFYDGSTYYASLGKGFA